MIINFRSHLDYWTVLFSLFDCSIRDNRSYEIFDLGK